MNFFNFKNLIGNVATVLVIAILLAASPISYQNPTELQRAEAIPVNEVGTNLFTNIRTTIQSTISAISDVATEAFAARQDLKDFVLDPLVWALGNALISQILTSLTEWVNSGFQGSPAFVTNINQFLLGVADEAAGRFIDQTTLGFLCSPFQIQIQFALKLQYAGSKSFEPACTLTDISNNIEGFINGNFRDGGWAAWFQLTQAPFDDPNKAFLEFDARRSALVLQTRRGNFEILQSNRFFRNIQICEEGISLSGEISNCTVSTLGHLVEARFNKALDLPLDRIAFADEFNELVGALLAFFANQVVMGVGGLLAMTDNQTYRNLRPNQTGSTYVARTRDEDPAESLSDGVDAISGQIREQQRYIILLNQTITLVNRQEDRLSDAASRFPGCFNVDLPRELERARTEAPVKIETATLILGELQGLQQAYNTTTDLAVRNDIARELSRIQASTGVAGRLDFANAQVDLDVRLPAAIADLTDDINAETSRCNGLDR